MKAYTDLKQSKKLAEILPLESVDMCYVIDYSAYDRTGKTEYNVQIDHYGCLIHQQDNLPCWSLAVLLDVLPKNLDIGRPVLATNYRGYYWVSYFDEYMKEKFTSKIYDNPVDACVEMILKLHELKML